jgi:hypothetical protein
MRINPGIVSLDGIVKPNGTRRAERSSSYRQGYGAFDSVEVSGVKPSEANLTVGPENLHAADSLINDARIAKNILDFAKVGIVSNADALVKGQANMSQDSIRELF